MNDWLRLHELAQRQYGLVAREQAAACGVPVSTIDKRAAREGWERPQPGVLALPGSVNSWDRRVMAAVLGAGPAALATRWTAAYLYGLIPTPEVPLTLVVPHGQRAPLLRGARVHRSRTLLEEDRRDIRGIPVVSPPRLLMDLARDTPITRLRAAAIDACQKRLTTPLELLQAAERLRGLRGGGPLTLVAVALLEGKVDSALEWQTRLLLSRPGLPAPAPEPWPVEANGRVVARIDIAWPEWRVGVECDGYRYHSERRQLEQDSARQNALAAAGWRILRLTWAQLDRDPGAVLGQVRALLRAAGCFC